MKRLRALLIEPPYNRLMGIEAPSIYPLGLSYLSAVLKAAGHKALYVNLDYDESLAYANPFSREKNISYYRRYLKECKEESGHNVWHELRDLLMWYLPDMVGISASTLKMKSVLKIAKIVKAHSKDTTVVVGGHHSQVYGHEILKNCRDIDFVIKGEGEAAIVELADLLSESEDKETKENYLRNIKGIVFRDSSGGVHETESRDLISDLDSLPYAEAAKYYKDGRLEDIPLSSIMGTRGCPYNCNYCATNNIWRRRVRKRSVKNVIDEIKYRMSNEDIYEFNFLDDCFTINKDWTADFCNSILKENIRINWSCISDVNSIDEDLFALIVKAGCNKINLGIESGSEQVLKICNKPLNLKYTKRIFAYARKYRISTTAYFMMGFPNETEDDIRKTQELIYELRPNWAYLNVLIPLPGTKFFERAVKEGFIDEELAWSGDIYEHLQVNYTKEIADGLFNNLVDESYALCYRLNKSMPNIFRRIPLRTYIRNPYKAILDTKKFADWIRK